MNYCEAKHELKQLLGRVAPAELPKLLDWIRNSDELDDLLPDNGKVILQSIADDLRSHLPLDAMLPSETSARAQVGQRSSICCSVPPSPASTPLSNSSTLSVPLHSDRIVSSILANMMQQRPQPTVHVDAFLYDDDQVDSLCDEGKMSRSYCLSCGSNKTAPLDFISHSFSISELRFLFQNVLPDLSGRTLVDVGSRLGAVLYGGYVYSSASNLVGLEISEEFVHLQREMVNKYGMAFRVQNADVLVMNNVFEYFMEPSDQVRCWRFIMETFRKKGSLLLTVPSLQESLSHLQEALQPDWVEELPIDYDVYMGKDADTCALKEIHLYRVI